MSTMSIATEDQIRVSPQVVRKLKKRFEEMSSDYSLRQVVDICGPAIQRAFDAGWEWEDIAQEFKNVGIDIVCKKATVKRYLRASKSSDVGTDINNDSTQTVDVAASAVEEKSLSLAAQEEIRTHSNPKKPKSDWQDDSDFVTVDKDSL